MDCEVQWTRMEQDSFKKDKPTTRLQKIIVIIIVRKNNNNHNN